MLFVRSDTATPFQAHADLHGREPLDRPLSIAGLHVVISKCHHRGTAFLYRFNAGLAELRTSARYDEIVSRYPGLFWEQLR